MIRRKRLGILLCAAALGLLAVAPTIPANAVTSGSLSLTAMASQTKVKLGTIVEYQAIVENVGTVAIPGVVVTINLPDALNARAVYCPLGTTNDTVVLCDLGDLAPATVTEVDFFVEVGARSPNGPVSVSAFSSDGTSVQADLPALKIIGSPGRH